MTMWFNNENRTVSLKRKEHTFESSDLPSKSLKKGEQISFHVLQYNINKFTDNDTQCAKLQHRIRSCYLLEDDQFIIDKLFNFFSSDNERMTFLTGKTSDELDVLCLSLKNAKIFKSYEKFDDFFRSFVNILDSDTSGNVTHGFIHNQDISKEILLFCKFKNLTLYLITSSTNYYVVNEVNIKERGKTGSSGIKRNGLGVLLKPLEMRELSQSDSAGNELYDTFSNMCTGIKRNKKFLNEDLKTLKLGASAFLKLYGNNEDRYMKIVVSTAEIIIMNSAKEQEEPHLNFQVKRSYKAQTIACYPNWGNKRTKISLPVLQYNILNYAQQQIAEFFIAKNPTDGAKIFLLTANYQEDKIAQINYYLVSEKPFIV